MAEKKQGYVVSQKEPGVISDVSILYTNDGGARTFYYRDRTVLRDGFAGRWERFQDLKLSEKSETEEIAKGALAFISKMEKKDGRLSEVDRTHRQILQDFLANPDGSAAQTHSAKE